MVSFLPYPRYQFEVPNYQKTKNGFFSIDVRCVELQTVLQYLKKNADGRDSNDTETEKQAVVEKRLISLPLFFLCDRAAGAHFGQSAGALWRGRRDHPSGRSCERNLPDPAARCGGCAAFRNLYRFFLFADPRGRVAFETEGTFYVG